MTPKLLIGMAVFDDFDGVYFTIQSLRMYHADLMPQIEIVVVDNNAASAHGKETAALFNWIKNDVAAAHYVPFTTSVGTAAPRNHIFSCGTAPAVMVVDPHVLFAPGSIGRLLAFYDDHPNTRNLYHGPMLYDNLEQASTHFEDIWGDDQMWGKWGTDERWRGEDPFEIPAQGLGLFSCRRDAWLGFNPRFRGFGGEEWYIHEKFRQAGRKVFCLPFLRWLHRFGRPSGVKYPLSLIDKACNYIVGLQELGIPLDRAKQSFVGSGKITEADWQRFLADPDIARTQQTAARSGCSSCQQAAQKTLEELYKIAAETPSDINEHVPTLRGMAAQCSHVTEFGVRTGVSTTALLAAQPKRLVSIDLNESPHARGLDRVKGTCNFEFRLGDSTQVEIEETDLLFIDTKHTAAHLAAELAKHHVKVRKWIAMHDTVIFGERGEDGGHGLLVAVRQFVREHPEWTAIRHDMNNYGFTVLSRDAADKQELPSLWKQAANAAKASWRAGANVLLNFGPLKDTETQDKRLSLCLLCPQQNSGKCAVCGCPIDAKTSWPTETCPLGKWSEEHAERNGNQE